MITARATIVERPGMPHPLGARIEEGKCEGITFCLSSRAARVGSSVVVEFCPDDQFATIVEDHPTRPGYHMKAAFEGADATWRPDLNYLCRLLESRWSIRIIGAVHGGKTYIVSKGFTGDEEGYRWWTISDNGGELNVWEINRRELQPASIPYREFNMLVPIGRLALWCRQTIFGCAVSYGSDEGDDIILEGL